MKGALESRTNELKTAALTQHILHIFMFYPAVTLAEQSRAAVMWSWKVYTTKYLMLSQHWPYTCTVGYGQAVKCIWDQVILNNWCYCNAGPCGQPGNSVSPWKHRAERERETKRGGGGSGMDICPFHCTSHSGEVADKCHKSETGV